MNKSIFFLLAGVVLFAQAFAQRFPEGSGDSSSEEEEDCTFSDKFCKQLQFMGMSCNSKEFKKYCPKYCKDDCDNGLKARMGPLIGMFRESNVAIQDMDVSLSG